MIYKYIYLYLFSQSKTTSKRSCELIFKIVKMFNIDCKIDEY